MASYQPSNNVNHSDNDSVASHLIHEETDSDTSDSYSDSDDSDTSERDNSDDSDTESDNSDSDDESIHPPHQVPQQQGGGGIREAGPAVRAAWSAFLESHDWELRLESMRLTPLCVEYLLDRLSWLPLHQRPQKISLCHVSFVSDPYQQLTDDDHHHVHPHNLYLPSDLTSPHVPLSAKLLAHGLVRTLNCVSLQIEDNCQNPRVSPATYQVLLEPFLTTTTTGALRRVRFSGLDWTRLPGLLLPLLQAHAATLWDVDLQGCRFANNGNDNDNDNSLSQLLVQGLSQLRALQSLSIYESGLNDALLTELVQSLSKVSTTNDSNSQLHQVLLYDNRITASSFGAFAQLLRDHPQLRHLKLAFWGGPHVSNSNNSASANRYSDDHAFWQFNQALARHTGLQKLDIFCKNTSAHQVVSWMHAFEQNASLQEFRFGVFCLQRLSGGLQQVEKSSTSSSTRLEMKYGMLAGNNVQELETLFQGLAQVQSVTQLVLNQCHFYSPRVARAFQQALHQLPRLQQLRLHSCRFHLESLEQSVAGLAGSNCQTLSCLQLAGCRLDDTMMLLLTRSLIQHLMQLSELDLSWNNITLDSLGPLTSVLRNCPALTRLNLAHNEFLFHRPGDHDNHGAVLGFMSTLVHHSTLNDLDLAASGLSMPMAVLFMKAWQEKTSSFKENKSGGLHLGFASLEYQKVFCGFRAGERDLLSPLLIALQRIPDLKCLEFCGTDLRGSVAGQGLKSILVSSQSCLTELNIYGVENPPLNQDTLQYLNAGFQGACKFESLRLGGCSLRDAPFASLAKSLTSGNLQHLYLRYNLLTAESLVVIAELLEQTSLSSLDLASNEMLFHCNEEELSVFTNVISKHKALKRLCLSHCGIRETSAEKLFRALETNNVLQHLDLGGNEIQLELFSNVSWLSSLSRWQSISYFKIPRGFRSELQWDRFLIALSKNISIRHLCCDQGQLPLIPTQHEDELHGRPFKEPMIVSLLQRNELLQKGRLVHDFSPSLAPRLFEKLGSNHEGTPLFALLRRKAAELIC